MEQKVIKYSICLDIGGSHISSAVINPYTNSIIHGSYRVQLINSNEDAFSILNNWCDHIQEITLNISVANIKDIIIAIPGPFDYKTGVSKILNLSKFDTLFSINVKHYIASQINFSANKIHLLNDATAFALGEYSLKFKDEYDKVLSITIGTGFGSTFIHHGLPQSRMLYNEPFKRSIADDYFSSRWFLKSFNKKESHQIENVKDLYFLAKSGNKQALKTFKKFGKNLSKFLKHHITKEQVECIVIGGNISKASEYFLQYLINGFGSKNNIPIIISGGNEFSSLIGASFYGNNQSELNYKERETTQLLIPESISTTRNGDYNIFPGFKVPSNSIKSYPEIAKYIKDFKTIIIDGYAGVLWEDLISNINIELSKYNVKPIWQSVSAGLKDSDEIDNLISPYLGEDDPLFGKRTNLVLTDFFNPETLNKINPITGCDINIIYGPGASLLNWDGPLLYVDIPKNELQFRMRAGSIMNFGSEKSLSHKEMYKRFYFVDWIVLNKHKKNILPQIDIIIDNQLSKNISWTTGECMRYAINEMSKNFFRVRPWFEPGPWGGTWIKNNIPQLSKDVPNYAWSFELITPENGLLLNDGERVLEFSFDFLMYQESKNILGEAASHFGDEFPIRFDFLDTFNGGNLSVQVHPQQKYFVKEFNESFTQDECYYILDSKVDSKVFLGFNEDINPEEFEEKIQSSSKNATPIEINKYVNTIKSKKHDLFLIPGGTIHSSGKNNLVLEISSTPYIFTFKLYDWLRLDLQGNPRPLNIERGFKNLDFSRKGDVINNEFVSKPVSISKEGDTEIIHLPTHKNHFYDVHRLEFKTNINISTNQQCHILMLVEGTSIILKTKNGFTQRFNYAETFVIPASCDSYVLENEDGKICKVIKAFVKSEKVKS